MRFTRLLLTAACVMASASVTVGAQHPLVKERLDKENAEHPTLSLADAEAAIFGKAKRVAEANGRCIPTGVALEPPMATTGDPFLLSGVLDGTVKNTWRVYAQFKGCGDDLIQRYAVIDMNDGKRVALPIHPGRSLTTLKLMRDTSPTAGVQALAAAKKRKPDCDGKDMDLVSTRIANEEKDLGPEIYGVRYTGSWTESWRLKTCGLSFDVAIRFTADGDGGAYTNIKGDEVSEVAEGL